MKVEGTCTSFFIPKKKIQLYKNIAYPYFVIDTCTYKDDLTRIYLTINCNSFNYLEDIRTPTPDMTTTTIILNSPLLAFNTRFITLNIKSMYL